MAGKPGMKSGFAVMPKDKLREAQVKGGKRTKKEYKKSILTGPKKYNKLGS